MITRLPNPLLTAFLLFFFSSAFSQNERGNLRIMFYNTENYFDITDDKHTSDNEYLPESALKWTSTKFRNKTLNLYKTIAAVGEKTPPEIICLAEIENREVLKELAYKTPLEKYPYTIVHFNSPDQRGIDVAILYNKDRIEPLRSEAIRIVMPGDSSWHTRDILYFKALTYTRDTLHIFVNHWPSRRGGNKKSEPKRLLAASVLNNEVEKILGKDPCANIVITGDFNDEPENISLSGTLHAINLSGNFQCNKLYNLSGILQKTCNCGTYRYRASWDMLDQFIVSGGLLDNRKGEIKTSPENIYIASFDFLMTDDEKYGGKKPFRTYTGPAYNGGFSDHLPVYLDIYF